MDINDPSSSHYEPGPQTGANPHTYDPRNPFYQDSARNDITPSIGPTFASAFPLVIAAIFILGIMLKIG